MSFCYHCGTKLEPGSKFCPSCGESVELNPSEKKPPSDVSQRSPRSPEPEAPSAPPKPPPAPVETGHPAPPPVPKEKVPSARPADTGAPVATPLAKKKLSGWKLAAITGGGAFVFLIGIIAIITTLVFSATSGVSGRLDEWFVRIRAADAEGAYAMTSPGFRKITSLDAFRQYLNSYPMIGNSVKATYSERSIENGLATVLGTLVDGAGTETRFAAQLVKEGEAWEVQSIQLPDPPVGSAPPPSGPEIAFKTIKHPEKRIEYSIPADWVEAVKGNRFSITPAKGTPYANRASMELLILPNKAANSMEEIVTASLTSLSGLAELKIDSNTPVLTNEKGEHLKSEDEIPEGQTGRFSSVVHYHYMKGTTPWKGLVIGTMRHDDQGRYHYIITFRSEESCWEELTPAATQFLGMKVLWN